MKKNRGARQKTLTPLGVWKELLSNSIILKLLRYLNQKKKRESRSRKQENLQPPKLFIDLGVPGKSRFTVDGGLEVYQKTHEVFHLVVRIYPARAG